MEEIKVTRTVEEVTGYKAFDGTTFKMREECEAYENTAGAVFTKNLMNICVGKKFFYECDIYEEYGYGSEEFQYAVVDIKDENDLEIINRFSEFYYKGDCNNYVGKEYIGKRVFINIGPNYDLKRSTGYPLNPRTKEDMIKAFSDNLDKFFLTQEEREKANEISNKP